MGNTTRGDDRSRGSDVLALGFATTVAMWTVGYVGRLPGVMAPAPVMLALMLLCLLGGGFLAARLTGGGVAKALQVGAVASLLDLLILGSLLTSPQTNGLLPSAAIWLPGFLVAGTVVAGLGGLAAPRSTSPVGTRSELLGESGLIGRAWDSAFALAACGATALLLMAGGVVTGQQAGLAVVDWPNSFGSNMFLYPLSRMTGGIFYEHSHRLIGSLVGLTTLVLTIQLWRIEDRRWVKHLAAYALLLVVIQGVLGGLRVTGHFTASQDAAVTRPSVILAIVHGVVGQIYFATMVALFCVTTPLWRRGDATVHPEAGIDHALSRVVVIVVIMQLVLGATLRHVTGGLLFHIVMAVIVAILMLFAGMRANEEYSDLPVVPRLGQWIMMLPGLQIVLGLLALWATGKTTADGSPHLADVILTTTHQTVGAVILTVAVMLAMWTRRLIRTKN